MKKRARKNDPADALWADYTADHENDELRNRLVEHYLPLADRIARSIARTWPEHVGADVIQSAVRMALIHLVERFEPDRGWQFGTFATPRLRGAALDELRQGDTASRQTRRRCNERAAGVRRLTQQLGRRPTTEEIEDELGPPKPADEVFQTRPLSTVLHDGEPGQKPITLEVFCESRPRREVQSWFAIATRGMSMDAKTAVWLYYAKGLSMQRIGEALELCESRVSQILKGATIELRRGGREKLLQIL